MIQILVSACLTGENCKWDGGNNRNEALLDFMERMKGKAEFHPVCPEQLGGLPTPRLPSERIGAQVVMKDLPSAAGIPKKACWCGTPDWNTGCDSRRTYSSGRRPAPSAQTRPR